MIGQKRLLFLLFYDSPYKIKKTTKRNPYDLSLSARRHVFSTEHTDIYPGRHGCADAW